MKLTDFCSLMETIAPAALAWERDNPGLLVGTTRTQINRVLVALDATPVTVQEAADWGADLLLTHHPLFWNPVRRILPDAPETAAAFQLIRHNIGLFAAHTNLDAAQGGVNDQLAECLGLSDVETPEAAPLLRVGVLPATTLEALAAAVQERLQTTALYCGEPQRPVSKVALLGGAGGSELRDVLATGADAFITGELKHNEALDAAQMGLSVIAAGHYETERVVLQPLVNRLQGLTNDVQYRVTRLESACLRGV